MRCVKSNDSKGSIIKPVGKVIRNILNALQVKCPNKDCGKVMTLEEYQKHEIICGLPKCQNKKCQKGSLKLIDYKDSKGVKKKFCSDMCKYSYIFQELLKKESPDKLCKWFHVFVTETLNKTIHVECDKRIENLKTIIQSLSGNTKISFNEINYSPGFTSFKWDKMKKGHGMQVSNGGENLFLNESCYAFRSAVSDTAFMEGVHYFEIISDKRTENELKIGVTKNTNFNYDTSFSDYNFGWAFYGIGQLRHANNASGDAYGKKFKKKGTLGVFLDMNKGILSFALDGDYFGVAFRSDELKEGPIFAAVSLLHIGGCTLQVGIPAPPYFFSDY